MRASGHLTARDVELTVAAATKALTADLAEARADVARFEAALDVANRELAQARAERDEWKRKYERDDLLGTYRRYEVMRDCANNNEELYKRSLKQRSRQRATIAALVVACRAAAKVMRDNKDVLGMDLIWEWSGYIFEHYNPELLEDEDIETTHARLRAAGYDVEEFEARIREVINQARTKRDKQAGEAGVQPDGFVWKWQGQGPSHFWPGDIVEVVSSPYSSVQAGTVATIKEARFHHFGYGCHLYKLADIPHDAFMHHELKLIKRKAKQAGE